MRIEQLLHLAGYGSRKQVKRLLQTRQVSVDGHIVMNAAQNVDTSIQRVCVGDKQLQLHEHVYYMLYKPKGVVSAVFDKQKQTVIDLLKPADYNAHIYPVGRLDADTEGLLLLTDNGPLGYRLLHPSHHVTKTYLVIVNGLLTQADVDQFAQGIVFIGGVICQPAQLVIQQASDTQSQALVTIQEGKYHQVKKMFLSVGKKVIHLKRMRFGPLQLDEQLQAGQYRALTTTEKQQLKQYLD